jgi:glycosyltransferase involved in cell wall biosynthesis
MRIAQIAPVTVKIPPSKYGGTERVIHALTEELVSRGHEVTLFASGDSTTSARLVSVTKRAVSSILPKKENEKVFDIYAPTVLNVLNIGQAYRMQDEFDIIHDHTVQNFPMSVPLADAAHTPVVATLHGAFTESNCKLFESYSRPNYVSISYAQRKNGANIKYVGNVYNGLSMEAYPFKASHKGYLLYIGRISLEKGVHFAIQTAKALQMPLIIAGPPDSNYKSYIKKTIVPQLTDTIRWIGEVNEKERNKLMSNAFAVLHPVIWPEPFGLTIIESMACGAPVIGFKKGSISELIKNGVSGYVVKNVEEMIGAVKRVSVINRAECRRYALQNFSASRMAQGYEEIYEKTLAQQTRREQFVIRQVLQKSRVPHYKDI